MHTASFFDRVSTYALRKKDEAVSTLVRISAQKYLWEYGEMLEISVDSQGKTVRVQALLKGETTPISISLERYEFVSENGVTWLRFEGLSTSREWINTLLETVVTTDRIAIPAGLATKLLKLAL